MKPFSDMGDAELGTTLWAIRPEPTPAFAAELDQRVAAGFPRRSPRRSRNPFARALAWLRAGSAWRLAIPAGGFAVVAIAVATILVATKHSGFEPRRPVSMAESAPLDASHPRFDSGEVGSGRLAQGSGHAAHSGPAPHKSGSASSEVEYQVQIPESGATSAAPSAASAAHRDVERATQITIGTKPGEVGEASSKVFEAVHAYGGVVLNSSTQNGSGARAEASFELLVPSGKVGDAMAAFSRIGEVVSRHETTSDITAPTVGAGERLQDSEARIEGLLAQLSEATVESEREVVEAELDSERRHAAHLKSRLADLKRRANLSRVSVRIVSGKGVLAPGAAGNGGNWSIGDALHDAGRLLAIAAGVAIVALAVLAPLALVLFLVWLAGRAWTRRARERALT